MSAPSLPEGLLPVRSRFAVGRRGFLKSASAASILGTAGAMLPVAAEAVTKLNFLGWQGYDTFLQAGNFEKTNGLALQPSYISSADEIIAKLRLDSAAIDITTPYFIHDHFLADGKLIQAIDLTKVPNFKNVDPVIISRVSENMSQNGNWYAVPMTFGSNCMVYNSALAAAPTSWTDLMKPEYKGKCALTTDWEGNIYAFAKVLGVKNPNYQTRDELKKTVELLIDLKRNHLRAIAASYGDLVTMLSSKEVVIAQGWEPVADWVGAAAPVKIAYPKETCMGFIEGYAIGHGSQHVDDALGYINNALSVAGQLAGAAANSMPAVVTAAMKQAPAENQAMYHYDDLDGYFTRVQIMKMYPLTDDGVHATWDEYQDAWEQVMKA
jgi:spermidine/putrescine transport system substrate-binding protein